MASRRVFQSILFNFRHSDFIMNLADNTEIQVNNSIYSHIFLQQIAMLLKCNKLVYMVIDFAHI